MELVIAILIIYGIAKIFSGSRSKAAKRRDDYEQDYYKQLYKDYYGKTPDHRISRMEMAELDELEEEEYEDE